MIFQIFVSGHHQPMETGMTSVDIINLVQALGAPMIFAGLAFWFIRYQYDQNEKKGIVILNVMKQMTNVHLHWLKDQMKP